jgi:hypothetical protein
MKNLYALFSKKEKKNSRPFLKRQLKLWELHTNSREKILQAGSSNK